MGKKDGGHGPGEYLPDETEGIIRAEDLPKPLIEGIDREAKKEPCPECGCMAHRLRGYSRHLHDLGDSRSGRPRELVVQGAQFHCNSCDHYFSTDLSDLCAKRSDYTHRVVDLAIRLVAEDNLPYRSASWHLWRDHRVFVPFATIQNWVEAAGKKAAGQVEGSYLGQALENFSGYIAVDELYDGPWCVLSIVDNRTFRRLVCRVVEEDVTQAHIVDLFTQFQKSLERRKLQLAGITTDGSNLYPAAIQQVFGTIPHQVCRFHVIAMITKAAREVAVHLYKQRVAKLPKLRGGRPRKGQEEKQAEQVRAEREKLLKLYRRRYTLAARNPDSQKLAELLELLTQSAGFI